jgi:hypothetical protein
MINLSKQSRILILVMGILALTAFFILRSYYSNLNKNIDPRIVEARTLYEKYNSYAQNNQLDSVLLLMDLIEDSYSQTEHYQNSYEIGVLYNNRAAAWLTLGFYSDLRDSTEKDSLVQLSKIAIEKSLDIYNNWEAKFKGLDESQIKTKIASSFLKNPQGGHPNDSGNSLDSFSPEEQEAFLNNRVSEIINSQQEILRRQSVAYTNLGMTYRYHVHYDSAVYCYEKALELWERNLTAKNNMNVLLGRPMEKQNIIQKLFPPERLD